MSNFAPPKRKAPPVPKFETSDKKIKQDKDKFEYEKFIQETQEQDRKPIIRETIVQSEKLYSPVMRKNSNTDRDHKDQEKQEPKLPTQTKNITAPKLNLNSLNSKLAKIGNMYADKIQTKKDDSSISKTPSQTLQKTEKSLFLMDREEYDPARPNDYEEIKMQIEKSQRGQKSLNLNDSYQTSITKPPEISKPPKVHTHQQSPSQKKNDTNKMEEEEYDVFIEKIEKFFRYSLNKLFFIEEKAVNIMEKLGYKFGQGLGKDGKGITAPIIHQKTGDNQAILTQSAGDLTTLLPMEVVVKKLTKQQGLTPSKVILLVNLVSSDEVDEELKPEVIEECQKYGKVTDCQIYIMPDMMDETYKVRIFVEYEKQIEAMYAYQNLHGRFFGNRVVEAAFYQENDYYNQSFEKNIVFQPIQDVFVDQ